jgi:hypothetical protein
MKRLHSPEHGGILCLSGLLLVMAVPLDTQRAAAPPTESSVQVCMKEAGCSADALATPVLAEVRWLVQAALAADPSSATSIESVQLALERAYADSVEQTDAAVSYTWVLIDGMWFRICNESAGFEVSFGQQGTVLVTIQAPMATPQDV